MLSFVFLAKHNSAFSHSTQILFIRQPHYPTAHLYQLNLHGDVRGSTFPTTLVACACDISILEVFVFHPTSRWVHVGVHMSEVVVHDVPTFTHFTITHVVSCFFIQTQQRDPTLTAGSTYHRHPTSLRLRLCILLLPHPQKPPET
jgi:hypothetical protein